jgi:hypothetical protein
MVLVHRRTLRSVSEVPFRKQGDDIAHEGAPQLRPLGLGEVLDRAVNVSVKHFVLLALIFVVFAVPLAIVEYFETRDSSRMLQAFAGALQAQATTGKSDPESLLRILRDAPPANGWTAILLALGFFVAPLISAAQIDAVAKLYLGGTVTFGEAYRSALRRWLPLIGLNCLYLVAALGAYLVAFIVLVILFLAIAAIVHGSQAAGVVAGVIAGTAALVSLFVLALLAVLAWEISYYGCVVENSGVVTSFSQGIKRVFAGVGIPRSLLFGCAYLAIVIGIGLFGGVGNLLLLDLTHSRVVSIAYVTIVRIVTVNFTTVFLGIFYFDLRVREEGFDLQLAVQAAEAAPLPIA